MKRLSAVCLLTFGLMLLFSSSLAVADEYPKIYGNELPRYPGAELISTGRQTTSMRDGLRLELRSADPVRKISAYYEEKLGELGWTVPRQRFPNETTYVGRFTKGNLSYQVMVTRFSPNKGETKITISLHER